jgi:hypothetical protein
MAEDDRRDRMRGTAAVGDGWHVGVVAAVAEETGAVLDVLGVARGTGSAPGGWTCTRA